MRKQDLEQSAVIGQVTSAPDTDQLEQMFSLIKGVPFSITSAQHMAFSFPKLAGQLLRTSMPDLPKSMADWQERLSAQAVRTRGQAIDRLTWDGAQYRVEYQIKQDTGDLIWVEEIGERLSGNDSQVTEISGLLRVIEAEKSGLRKAAYHARYDPVSGLMNKRRFELALTHTSALMQRQHGQSAIIRLRATNLDDINSVYGYDTGDRIIALIGERMKGQLRSPDHIARLSETDFGICVIGADEAGAFATLERIKEALLDTPYATPHGGLYIEFSNAVSIIGSQGFRAKDVLRQTELVFETQGNDFGWTPHVYAPAMGLSALADRTSLNDTKMADDIIAALNERRISLAYQPIIDARTRDLHHYECLLRLRRDDGEIVSAGRVIMAAEKLGLVHLLDRRALELAAESLRQSPDIHIALNVSAATLKDEEAVDDYINALRALGPDAKRITLELTETAALDDPGLASFFSVETRKLGCAFAIDDFGSGYTTFRNLMAIEADSIKIDGSYIQGIATEPYKETFVRMMVDLAQTFSVKTVAEMVDNRADAELLRRLGVDYLQGYFFGIPSAAPAWHRKSA